LTAPPYTVSLLHSGTADYYLAKWEDSPSQNGRAGLPPLAVRKASPANTSDSDGDFEYIQMSAGRLWTTAGIDGAALTALQLIDDPVQVLGTDTYSEATSKGMTIGAVRRDADTTLVNTTNEFGPLQMDANGRLKVEAFSGETLPVSLSSTTITSLPDEGQQTMASSISVAIASNQSNVPVSQATASSLNAQVVGAVAHSGGVSGNPLLLAGVSQDSDDTAPPNRVDAESDITRLATDRDGSLHVLTHGPQIWSYHENSSSALTDTTVHSAPASGLSLYVTDIVFSTGSATACNILFEEGSTTVLGPYYLEAIAGRGMALHFTTPKKITAATALTVTTSAAIAHSIDVTGYVGQG
jgi:hypothetical protein